MPTLDWIGKDKVVNHHLDVPYRVLERKYSFDEKGQHEEDNGSENMIIHGDNLEALKSLLPKYEGKIDCIYIDPPYNTGEEGWVYNDNVNDPRIKKWLGEVVGKEGEDLSRHDKWLCMMYPRLRLLQKLLSNDGVLAISIGWQELYHLVEICGEIFASSQIQTVSVQTSGGKPSCGFNMQNEYIVFVAPRERFSPNPDEEAQKIVSSPFHGMNLATFTPEQRPNQTYPIYIDEETCAIVGVGKSLQVLIEEGIFTGDKSTFSFDYDGLSAGTCVVWPVTKQGEKCVWRLKPERFLSDWKKGYVRVLRQKPTKTNKNCFSVQYLADGVIQAIESKSVDVELENPNSKIPTLRVRGFKTGSSTIPTIWTDKKYYTAKGALYMQAIFGNKRAFPYPKPVELVYDIVKRVSKKDSIILDSFAGSGTTAHAVLLQNCIGANQKKFILIEMSDYAEDKTAERVKRVIQGYGEGKNHVEGIGGSFGFYELGESLMVDKCLNEEVGVDKIREYIYYTETKTNISQSKPDEPCFMGLFADTAYYFNYEKGSSTTLNHSFLSQIRTKAESYVIYADSCTLSKAELEKYHIVFKKIPRDISRF